MPSFVTPGRSAEPGAQPVAFCFRCIGCSALTRAAAENFRCSECGNLLEITDPAWTARSLDPAALKSLWRERRSSNALLDLSGVWRFRELLPAPASAHVVTLREGNTPLYELPRCSRAPASSASTPNIRE